MGRSRGLLVKSTAIAALALGGGVALWYRVGLRGTPAGAGADRSQHASAAAGSRSELVATPAASAPVDATAAAARPAEARAESDFHTGDADQRQTAKITRGMDAAPGGGIVVTATPPGSVTAELRLRQGDVIVAVNGETISSPDEFARIYREQGLPRQLTILRDGREIHRH